MQREPHYVLLRKEYYTDPQAGGGADALVHLMCLWAVEWLQAQRSFKDDIGALLEALAEHAQGEAGAPDKEGALAKVLKDDTLYESARCQLKYDTLRQCARVLVRLNFLRRAVDNEASHEGAAQGDCLHRSATERPQVIHARSLQYTSAIPS